MTKIKKSEETGILESNEEEAPKLTEAQKKKLMWNRETQERIEKSNKRYAKFIGSLDVQTRLAFEQDFVSDLHSESASKNIITCSNTVRNIRYNRTYALPYVQIINRLAQKYGYKKKIW